MVKGTQENEPQDETLETLAVSIWCMHYLISTRGVQTCVYFVSLISLSKFVSILRNFFNHNQSPLKDEDAGSFEDKTSPWLLAENLFSV